MLYWSDMQDGYFTETAGAVLYGRESENEVDSWVLCGVKLGYHRK